MPHLWQDDPRSQGLEPGPGGSTSLLGEASRRHAAEGPTVSAAPEAPDLGDLVVVLLASTLAGLRDRLSRDGYERAADLVADLVQATDDYLAGMAA